MPLGRSHFILIYSFLFYALCLEVRIRRALMDDYDAIEYKYTSEQLTRFCKLVPNNHSWTFDVILRLDGSFDNKYSELMLEKFQKMTSTPDIEDAKRFFSSKLSGSKKSLVDKIVEQSLK